MLVRQRETAPDYVLERGGVLLSMWHMGTGEADIAIVAKIIERCERYRDALELIADNCGDDAAPEDNAVQIAEEALR